MVLVEPGGLLRGDFDTNRLCHDPGEPGGTLHVAFPPAPPSCLPTDEVFQPLEESLLVFRRRPGLRPERFRELLYRFALRGIHLLRHAHGEQNVLVALAAAVEARDSFALEREDAARGGTCGHVEAGLAVERRDTERAAERRERERYGPGENDVEPVAPELLVRRHGDEGIKVPRASVPSAGIPFAREAQSRAFVHSRGDRHGQRSRTTRAAVAATVGTGILHSLTGALAVGTRASHGEESLPV